MNISKHYNFKYILIYSNPIYTLHLQNNHVFVVDIWEYFSIIYIYIYIIYMTFQSGKIERWD